MNVYSLIAYLPPPPSLVDEVGQPMGPYRVWLQYAWVPGLAMSRALGDQLAHQVGGGVHTVWLKSGISACANLSLLLAHDQVGGWGVGLPYP